MCIGYSKGITGRIKKGSPSHISIKLFPFGPSPSILKDPHTINKDLNRNNNFPSKLNFINSKNSTKILMNIEIIISKL